MAGTKRRRIVFSCTECRRRKVHCDRTKPVCVRCQKSSADEACKYVAYRDEEDESQVSASSDAFVRAESADTWVDEATEYLKNASTTATPAGTSAQSAVKGHHRMGVTGEPRSNGVYARHINGNDSSQPPRPPVFSNEKTLAATFIPTIPLRDQSILCGKGFSTKYYGPTHFASILSDFTEFGTFIISVLNQVNSKKSVNQKIHAQFKSTRKVLDAERSKLSHERTTLLSLLPDHVTSEKLAHRYFETIEVTYRVLHTPTFWKKFKSFWENPEQSDDAFLVLLLVVMACANCLVEQEPQGFIGRNSLSQVKATDWVKVSESWLLNQSHKHVPLITFQIRVLLFLAKRVNRIKVKRGWNASGDLVRHAMTTGLHREPGGQVQRVSIFEQEMRRRIWATIVELELMTSLDQGFRPSVEDGDWDCKPPSNLHDEELSVDMESLPDEHASREPTRTSSLILCAESAALRSKLISKLNRTMAPPADFIAEYDQRLRQEVAVVTSWTQSMTHREKQRSQSLIGLVPKLQLLELLLVLHQSLASSNEDLSGHNNSRAAFREASAMILETYANMAVEDSSFLSCIRTDNIRAALCMCYDLCEDSLLSSSVTFNRIRAVELIETASGMVSDHLMRIGEGYHDHWLVSCGLSLVQMRLQGPDEPLEHGSNALDRLLKLMDKVIELQKSKESFSSELVGSMDFDVPSESQTQFDPFLPMDPLLPFDWVDLEPLDFWNPNMQEFVY